MKNYSELMQDFRASAPAYKIEVGDNWKQGRTAFGGLTAALLLEAVQNDYPDLPPLRTLQVNFIGPAEGEIQVSHKLLRKGKNNVSFYAEANSDLGNGTHALMTFGVGRDMQRDMDYPVKQIDVQPEDLPFVQSPPEAPRFLDNMDRRWVSGPRFMDGSDTPDVLVWGRLADEKARAGGMTPLILLTDTPPAALTFIKGPVRALSSMNWNINMLTDDYTTRDGWWLMRSATRFVKDGYSSQLIQVWNSEGRRVMDAMQHQAIF